MLSSFRKRTSILASLILPFCFLFGAYLAQVRYDAVWQEHFELLAPVHRYILPAPVVKYLSFGFRNILADYYWVTAVQDLNKWDRKDFYFPEEFRIISALDPKFEYPYIFAALTIPTKTNPESLKWVSLIAEEGMKALPNSWQIPFYVGLEYQTVGKSYEQAVHYLAIAAAKPGSPEITREAYGMFMLHTSTDYERSRALFNTIYQTTDNEETKIIAKFRLTLLDLLEAVDQASLRYKAKYHSFPNSLDQLTKLGFITVPTELVKRFPVMIDEQTGKSSLKDIREATVKAIQQ